MRSTFYFIILLTIVGVMLAARPGCRISIRRQRIDPLKLGGVWHEVKFLMPPGFTGSSTLRYSWNIIPLYSGTLSITEARRPQDTPDQCTFSPATWTPTNRKNIFSSYAPTGSFLRNAEFAIIDTDYKTYLVVYRCTSSFQQCDSVGVVAFVRAEQAGPDLIRKIDRILVQKTCTNLKDFFLAQTPNPSCYYHNSFTRG